ELLVDDDIPALGTERHLHRIRQLVHAPLELGPGFGAEFQKLGCHVCASSVKAAYASFAMTSASLIRMISSPSNSTCVPLYFPYTTRSPTFSSIGIVSPFSRRPGPTAMTSPWIGFSLAVSGMYSPPFIVSVSSIGRIATRSASG